MKRWRPVLNFYNSAYDLLWKSFGSEIIGFLSLKSLKDPEFKRGRLGFYDGRKIPAGRPRIWCHAASVGEATGAISTLVALKKRLPDAAVFMTSGTPQGLKFARAQVPAGVSVFAFPLDSWKCVSRAVSALDPDLFVNFETEFWPNFFRELHGKGIPALLLNGRISASSERLYRLFSPLFRPVFEQFTHMGMHSREDMERAVRIGAPVRKVVALGSSKYEGLAEKACPQRADFWSKLLRTGDSPVLIGGSLRGSESIELMRVYRELRPVSTGLLGIFAPRHMENIPRMTEWLEKK